MPTSGRGDLPESPAISVILPTFGREDVLIDTLNALRILPPENKEILVIDQTPEHDDAVEKQLHDWMQNETIRWVRLSQPSIPAAMNQGAKAAMSDFVLYLDDDIVPDPELLLAHISAQKQHRADLIAGRVLQPWDNDESPGTLFASKKGVFVSEFMGGNFSISRELLQEMGGFDENFRGAAYRFEKEFADRLLEKGGTIWFDPTALIHHLHYTLYNANNHLAYRAYLHVSFLHVNFQLISRQEIFQSLDYLHL